MIFKTILFISLLVVSIAAVDNQGFRTDEEVLREMKNENNTVIGDMIIPPMDGRRASWDQNRNWPDNTIPYFISENVTAVLKDLVNQAINYYHKYTCIKFKPAKADKNKYWVRFMMDPEQDEDTACSAGISFQNKKDQAVSLGPDCQFGNMVHELGHTLGFMHEHMRRDRDDFIKINFQNINKGGIDQFDREDAWCKKWDVDCAFNTWNVPYNYDSIMHYCDTCFAKKAGLKTIVTLKNPNAIGTIDGSKIGQRHGFSKGDWLAINRKYGCDPDKNPQIAEPPPLPKDANIPVYPKPKPCKTKSKA